MKVLKKTRASWLLLVFVLVIGFLVILSWAIKPASKGDMRSISAYAVQSSNSLARPPASCSYCTLTLLEASPEETGQFAQRYLVAQGNVQSGMPEVLLVRPVTRQDLATLGLACVGSSSTIEDAPWALVILKGDFDFRGGLGGELVGPGYTALVFDRWAADLTYWQYSKDGSHFRLVLNDPTLPGTAQVAPLVCPTEVPRIKTLHYGDVAPTPPPPAEFSVLPMLTGGSSNLSPRLCRLSLCMRS